MPQVRCTAANAEAADMGFEQRGRPGGRANAAGVEGVMGSMRGSATFRSCAKTEQEEIQELVRFWVRVCVCACFARGSSVFFPTPSSSAFPPFNGDNMDLAPNYGQSPEMPNLPT